MYRTQSDFVRRALVGNTIAPHLPTVQQRQRKLWNLCILTCGKMQEKSLGGAEYFLTFTDDKTRYMWVYILKTKDQVFNCFLQWKALVERQSKRKLKTLRTDNGEEYTSNRFEKYLKDEGI